MRRDRDGVTATPAAMLALERPGDADDELGQLVSARAGTAGQAAVHRAAPPPRRGVDVRDNSGSAIEVITCARPVQLTRLTALARHDRGRGSRSGRARLRRGLAVICILAGLILPYWIHPPAAHAQDEGRVLVVPLDSTVPDAQAGIVLAFNLALAESLQREAEMVTVAQTSLGDTMAIIGCSERSAPCLSRVAEALAVDYIVYGSVAQSAQPDTFEVTLVVARREADSQPSEDRFMVRAAAASEAERAFAEAAPRTLLAPRTASSARPIDGAEGSHAFDVNRVERSSWIVAGAGGAAFSMGIVFWLLASSSQSDVNAIEVGSSADLERLIALEERTQTRANIGNVLVIAGTATAAVGAVMAVRQGLVRTQPARIDVAPMATESSVGITLTIDWP